MNHTVFVGLGSNRGNRISYLARAREEMRTDSAYTIISESPLYETAPVGVVSAQDFINQVLILETEKSYRELFTWTSALEKELGRIRPAAYGEARTIDIDILAYDDVVMKEPDLEIPHPRMHERLFVLMPLKDIAPDWVHPVYKKSVADLCTEVIVRKGAQQRVRIIEEK